MKSVIILVTLLLLCFLPVDARKMHARATGRILCRIDGRNYRVPHAIVRLKDRDSGRDDTFGSTRSSRTGWFRVSGRAGDRYGKPDPYIQVEYQYRGIYGRLDVENAAMVNRKDKTRTRRYSRYLGFGNLYFSGDSCRAYVMTLRAMKDYRRKARKSLPYSKLRVVTLARIHGRTPYATTNKIRIPRGYRYRFSTAKHELAHTIRHSLVSGIYAHFI